MTNFPPGAHSYTSLATMGTPSAVCPCVIQRPMNGFSRSSFDILDPYRTAFSLGSNQPELLLARLWLDDGKARAERIEPARDAPHTGNVLVHDHVGAESLGAYDRGIDVVDVHIWQPVRAGARRQMSSDAAPVDTAPRDEVIRSARAHVLRTV